LVYHTGPHRSFAVAFTPAEPLQGSRVRKIRTCSSHRVFSFFKAALLGPRTLTLYHHSSGGLDRVQATDIRLLSCVVGVFSHCNEGTHDEVGEFFALGTLDPDRWV